MNPVTLTIDDIEVKTTEGVTVLQAAQGAGAYIPSLCAHPDLPPFTEIKAADFVYRGNELIKNTGSAEDFKGCQLCIVEIEGIDGFPTACTTAAGEGMVVHTNTPQVQELRRNNLALILAKHPHACLICAQREGCSLESCSSDVPVSERCCPEFGRCELQKVADYIGIPEDTPRYIFRELPQVRDEPLFEMDYNLCIGCGRCVRVCQNVRGVGAIGAIYYGSELVIGTTSGPSLKESGCKFCGACVEVCPTGTLMDKGLKRGEREATLVPCRSPCPAGIDIPRYIHLIAEGRFAEALAVVREKVPFPSVLGHVCPHPCEEECRRGQLNHSVSISRLKRFAAEHDTGLWKTKSSAASPTHKRVAILGSGPSGLTAAYYLAKLGHSVIVFEALPVTGGMMRVGIPRYRLPVEVLDSEITAIEDIGVEIKVNSKVESLDELFAQGYDAIFVGIGAHRGIRMGMEGEDIAGVIDGADFLRDVSLGREVKVGDRVVVIGGGDVAIDAARTALRLGAKEAAIVYRRTRAEMPASPEEVEAALEEGVKIEYLAAPVRAMSVNGKLKVEFIRMELGEIDASGRRRPQPIEGSEFDKTYDMMIKAIGQEPDLPDGFASAAKRGGGIEVDDETLATAREGVYAGGDVVSGPASVIEAIAAGRQAAISIDRYLGGNGAIDEILLDTEKTSPWLGRDEGFADKRRASMPCLPVEQRLTGFAGVELGFDEAAAVEEAKRCLRCDLRLQISPVTLPPEKWLEFSPQNVSAVPETEGVYQLLDGQKTVIYIAGTPNLRQSLEEHLSSTEPCISKTGYFWYEPDSLYTMKESELIQQFLQQHARMPEGNEELLF